MARLYFDNAATSYPKAPGVADVVAEYLRADGVPAGRGAYRQAMDVERHISRCRQLLADLFRVPDPQHVIFTLNGTDSLNLAILGLCRAGDHVVTSTWEHNSVLRPLRMLNEQRGVDVTWLEPDAHGLLSAEQVAKALRANTRLVALQHANNVVGTLQPVAEIAAVVRNHGAFLLVDAAQSVGHHPLDMTAVPIDLLAFPGHKGLTGPLGTGVLCLSERVADPLQPLRFGGTGTHSEDDHQPSGLPHKFEAGNLNVPGILGLAAALEWRTRQDLARAQQQLDQQTARLWTALGELDGITLFGAAPEVVPRTAVISLQIDGFDPRDAAVILDDSFGIQTRAGLHCAPGVHRSLGTFDQGGTLRLSPGTFTTDEDIDHLITALTALVAG